jgi:putative transposase
MPRGKSCCPGGTVFHVLNRGNGRQTLFFASGYYEAFVRVVKEALLNIPMRTLGYCLMPNHWHFVLWPELDDQLSAFMHQLMTTHVRRCKNVHHCEGEGRVHQGRFKSFPVESDEHLYTVCRYVERSPRACGAGGACRRLALEQRPCSAAPGRSSRVAPRCLALTAPRRLWLNRVNRALTGAEIEALRRCAERGRPCGSGPYVDQTARQLRLGATLRSRGRPPKKTSSVRKTLSQATTTRQLRRHSPASPKPPAKMYLSPFVRPVSDKAGHVDSNVECAENA